MTIMGGGAPDGQDTADSLSAAQAVWAFGTLAAVMVERT